jgi:hypothetical protein
VACYLRLLEFVWYMSDSYLLLHSFVGISSAQGSVSVRIYETELSQYTAKKQYLNTVFRIFYENPTRTIQISSKSCQVLNMWFNMVSCQLFSGFPKLLFLLHLHTLICFGILLFFILYTCFLFSNFI